MPGARYAAGRRALGHCGRCGAKRLLNDLIYDGQIADLRVCPECFDPQHPQDFFPDVTDPVTLRDPTMDGDRAAASAIRITYPNYHQIVDNRLLDLAIKVDFNNAYYSIGGVTGGVVGDPYWENVVLLLHFDGSDGDTATSDSSASAHVMAFTSDAELDDGQKQFGDTSLMVNNTALPDQIDDSVIWSVDGTTDFDFGSGAWVIEFFYRAQISTGARAIVSIGTENGEMLNILLSNGNIAAEWVDEFTATDNQVFVAPHVNNTWHHVAMQRGYPNADDLRCWFDGTESTTGTAVLSDTLLNPAGWGIIGAAREFPVIQEFNGWIDEVRITKGVTRYTADFNVPGSAYPDNSSGGTGGVIDA